MPLTIDLSLFFENVGRKCLPNSLMCPPTEPLDSNVGKNASNVAHPHFLLIRLKSGGLLFLHWKSLAAVWGLFFL